MHPITIGFTTLPKNKPNSNQTRFSGPNLEGINSVKAVKINARQKLRIDKSLLTLNCAYKKIAVNIEVQNNPNLIFEGN